MRRGRRCGAVLMILTLGLILPWREAALERYKMRHSYYGDLQGSFEGRGWEFFKRGWWLWLLAVVRCSLHLDRRLASVTMQFRSRRSSVDAGWRLSSMAPSRPWSGAGGFPASASAMSGLNRRCRRGALIGLYWKVIGWFVLIVVLFAAICSLARRLVGEREPDRRWQQLFVPGQSAGKHSAAGAGGGRLSGASCWRSTS